MSFAVFMTNTFQYHLDEPIVFADQYNRADSRLAPSQWETSLQSNAVSHWLAGIKYSGFI